MSSAAELANAINAIVGAGSVLATAGAADDLFEVYVWSLLVKAARDEGAHVDILTPNGPAQKPFLFRRGPGVLASPKPYVFARFAFDGKPLLEAHQGVYVQGKSKLAHEADVALIQFPECEVARAEAALPRQRKVELAVECKFYVTPLGVGLGRGFMGLVRELGGERSVWMASNASAARISRMITHHGLEWEGDLKPGSDRETGLYFLVRRTIKRFLSTA